MTPQSEIDPLDLLADEFVERLRRGEHPAPEEYAARHPEAADRIRELFPALAAMEGAADALTNAGTASAVTEVDSRPSPERIGDYRILREVGRGGMGVVYEAEQISLGRRVALKVLLPQYHGRGRFLERFRREARAAGRLHHTNIVPVFGVGESDGTHYYVMQFIAGVGLDQVIRDVRRLRRTPADPDPIPADADETLSVAAAKGLLTGTPVAKPAATPADTAVVTDTSALTREGGYYHAVARLALQAARAVDHAHGHGVVHRDVKPSNMLLDAQGNLWVTDFGLAKTEEASDLTGSHDILGTMRYMAPERFGGAATDVRSDVYSLGLTLYEMLTLRPAFAEYDRLRLIQQIGIGSFRRPREIDRRIPRDLETIVLKAAAREPKDRYRTAGALAEDLELFLANRPIRSRRASALEHMRRWARRNPVVAGLTGTVAVLLVAITVLSVINSARLGRTNKDLDTKRIELAKALSEQGTLRANSQDEAWHAHLEATRGGRFSGREGQRFEGIRHIKHALELAPERDLLNLRNEAVGCLTLPDVEAVSAVPWPYGTERVTFSRDLSRYARIGTDAHVVIRRVADDSVCFELPRRGRPYGYHGIRFSPDDRYLAHWVQNDALRIWRVDGDAPALVLTLPHARPSGSDPGAAQVILRGYDFLADRSRLVVVDTLGTVRVFDLSDPDPDRRSRPTIEGRLSANTAVVVWAHPTRPERILLTGYSQMTVYDLSRKSAVFTRPTPDGHEASWAAWHPDGSVYAFAENGPLRRIQVCAADTGVVLTTLSGHTNNGLLVAFDPAGDRLWGTDWNNQTRLWDWRTGRAVFEAEAAVSMPPVVTADGSLAGILRGDRAEVWRVAAGREATRLPVPANVPVGMSAVRGSPVVSPDGRLLAAPYEEFIALYDLPARELIGTIPAEKAMPVRFDADGSGLLVGMIRAGQYGLFRIPFAVTGRTVRVGSPEVVVPLDKYYDLLGLSADGEVLAVPIPLNVRGTWLYRGRGQSPVLLGQQRDVRFCSVSPDGQWVISGSHGVGTVTLWHAPTARRFKHLEEWSGHSSFSPDGRWASTFRTDTRTTHIWDTTTWESGPAIPGERGVFSPDGKLFAVPGDAGVVRLVRVPDGEEVVKLSVPDNVQFIPACFTADGGTLVARAAGSGFIQVWDVHAIRRQLRPMGLDWDDAPLPAAPPEPFRYPPSLALAGPEAAKSPPAVPGVAGDPLARWAAHSLVVAQHPLHPAGYIGRAEDLMALNRFDEALAEATMAVRLDPDSADGYRVRGRARRAAGDRREALADFDRAVALAPDSVPAHTARANVAQELRDDAALLASARRLTELRPADVGWWVVLATVRLVGDPEIRDVPAALAAAHRAVQLNPNHAYYQIVLGFALLEDGQADAAAKRFAESRRLRAALPYDTLTLFGLAICAQQSGDPARARNWFAMAVAAKDTGRFTSELPARVFDQMYRQAAEALGLPGPPRKE